MQRHRLDSRLLLVVNLLDAVGLAVRPVMMRVGRGELVSNQRRVSIGILVRHRSHHSLPRSDYLLLGWRLWVERDVLARTSLSTQRRDRKSTRLNSSHLGISYAVFCLKKKKKKNNKQATRPASNNLP